VGGKLTDLSYKNRTWCNLDSDARSKCGLPHSALFPQLHCKTGNFTAFEKKIEVFSDQKLDITVWRKIRNNVMHCKPYRVSF